VHGRDFIAVAIEVCNTLAPGTEWHPRPRRGRVVLTDHVHGELASESTVGVSTLIEHLAQLTRADLTLRGDDGHGAAG
jgi:hypothetical protein